MKSGRSSILLAAFIYTAVTLLLGYLAFGLFTSLLFSSGFLGGFILWWWADSKVTYEQVKVPYLVCLILFLAHRFEEKYMGFFAFLSDVTGVTTPEILSWEVVGLVAISVGSWLAIPFLLKRGYEFGYYFAWTFFAAMGFTELAHWIVFPFLLENPFQYIPGMISVVPLAPMAWFGMRKLLTQRRVQREK